MIGQFGVVINKEGHADSFLGMKGSIIIDSLKKVYPQTMFPLAESLGNISPNLFGPVRWGYRIHLPYLYREVRPPNEYPDKTLNSLMVRFQLY